MAHVRLNTAGPTADGRARQDGSGRDGGTAGTVTTMGTSGALRRRASVAAGTFVLLFGGGVAVAAWTATGTGQGSARAADVTGLAVSADTPVGR